MHNLESNVLKKTERTEIRSCIYCSCDLGDFSYFCHTVRYQIKFGIPMIEGKILTQSRFFPFFNGLLVPLDIHREFILKFLSLFLYKKMPDLTE